MSARLLPQDEPAQLAPTYGLIYRGLAADAQRDRIAGIVAKLLHSTPEKIEEALQHPPLFLASNPDRERVRKHQLGLANLGCITSIDNQWAYRNWTLDSALKERFELSTEDTQAEVFALVRMLPPPGQSSLKKLTQDAQHCNIHVLNHSDILLHSRADNGAHLRPTMRTLQSKLRSTHSTHSCQVAVGLFPEDGEHMSELLDCLQHRLDIEATSPDDAASTGHFGTPRCLAGRRWLEWVSLPASARRASKIPPQVTTESETHWPDLYQPGAVHTGAEANLILRQWNNAQAEREKALQRLQIHCQRLDQLPSLPAMVMKIYQLAQDKDSTSGQLSALVEQDPSLSARILSMVNSSWFGLRARVESIEHALVVIGREELAHLALMISSEKVFRGMKSDGAERLWRHSSHVAEIARALGRRIDSQHSSALYTAGLLHDVGKILLLSFEDARMQQIQKIASDSGLPGYEVEREIWGHDHAKLGAMMLQKWGLPAALCRIVEQHHGPQPGDAEISLDAALIALADHLAHRMDNSETYADELRLRRCHLLPLQAQFGELNAESLDLLCVDLRDSLRGPADA